MAKNNRMPIRMGLCVLSFLGLSSGVFASGTQKVTHVTLLHTNDLHSHFRPDRSPLQLGGIGRIKTQVDRFRKQNPNTLLVDGGDWSEGNIYYTQGAGTETLKMMDRIGYDVAVVGNHDFLNGPEVLLDAIKNSNVKMSLILNNVSLNKYSKRDAFRKVIPPYVIKEVGGKKIAFIGLTTFEFIYDRFFKPIDVKEPFLSTESLAKELKKEADAVVVISHNSIWANKWILKGAPDVDLVIGAHDHIKIDKAIEVKRRDAKPGWIVETGCWGHYLGKVELDISTEGVTLKDYKLTQMDSTVPEDSTISTEIEALEKKIEKVYGPIFTDQVAHSSIDLKHTGEENLIGNLVTDAFVKETGADFAIESNHAIYGDLFAGEIRTVDVFNVYPAIFNPHTGKTWTLKKLPIKGSTLRRLLTLMYASNKLRSLEGISTSGLQFTVNPLFLATNSTVPLMSPDFFDGSPQELPTELFSLNRPFTADEVESISRSPVIQDLKIGGKPYDPDKTYTMVTGDMLIMAFELLDSFFPVVPIDDLQDTGLECWRSIGNHLQKLGNINSSNVKIGHRAQTSFADLGVYAPDVSWQPLEKSEKGMRGKLQVQLTNYGGSASPESEDNSAAHLSLLSNIKGLDLSDPVFQPLTSPIAIPALEPGKSWTYASELVIPAASLKRDAVYPIAVEIDDGMGNKGPTNKRVSQLFY